MFSVVAEIVTNSGRFTERFTVTAVSALAAGNVVVDMFRYAVYVHIVSVEGI